MTKKIIITGTVQGVGFRPFIYNLAKSLNLKGTVSNTSQGVLIYVNVSNDEELRNFIKNINEKKPVNSKIDNIYIENVKNKVFNDFEIIISKNSSKKSALIPPDLAICKDCVSDIVDKSNRRYLYPFTNCTNCGPRFSITEKIPYDRKNTSMGIFRMCGKCLDEYNDPNNRRFHAQPNACPVCGPEVWVVWKGKKVNGIKAIDFIVEKVVEGEVVLIKGLGGFHIACDAFNYKSVEKVRKIKKREFKPFAVMFGDLFEIDKYLELNSQESEILTSSVSPIVMLKKKDYKNFEYVSPKLDCVGVMIPYTPLHLIIFKKLREKGFFNPLVMTSGNFKDEPIITDNEEALSKFNKLAVLCHDREIINRVDDSIGFVDETNIFRLIRRSRGYVPSPIKLSYSCNKEVFACGGDLKNSFAFLRGEDVFLSQYIGDLDTQENAVYYKNTFNNIKKLYDFKPTVMICDMHPLYRSSFIASNNFNIAKKIYVQHHIAHIYSVMAEYNLYDNLIGISFDGTGYGMDGNIWGGEFFILKNKKITRISHLENFFIFGGDSSIKDIWKSFVSVFSDREDFIFRVLKGKVNEEKIKLVLKSLNKKINGFYSSSCGRLFDAFSVVVTGKTYSDFEAEGPMRMETFLIKDLLESYKFSIEKYNGKYILRYSNFLDEVIYDYEYYREKISTKFHNSIINVIVDMCNILRKEYSINNVVLSGGVFQNRYILNGVIKNLSIFGFKVYSNRLVPLNDGGISLGQIYWSICNHSFIF
ncbi:MAG: carbamoyltransferase HypF [Elusimicrobiales bacterium]|nr:carbamoyltransferase HypF [Elusimicrobiales bacterium]